MTKKTVYRNSENGQFTTPETAKKNPKTTQKEHITTSKAPNNTEKTVGRSSINGRFIKKGEAKAEPNTTETQHISKGKPKKRK